MKEQKPSVTQIIEFLEDKKENKEIVEEELLNTIIVYLEENIQEKIKANEEIKEIFASVDEVKNYLIQHNNLNARQKTIIRNFDNFNIKYNNGKERINEAITEGLEITKNNPTVENVIILSNQSQILNDYTTLFIGIDPTLQTPVSPRIQEQVNKAPKNVKSLSKKYNK